MHEPGVTIGAVASTRGGWRAALLGGVLALGAIGVACASQGAVPVVPDGSGSAEQRERFLTARDALRAGDRDAFDAAYAGLDGYPIRDWLAYEDLSARWRASAPDADAVTELERFAADDDSGVLTRRLASRLQSALARAEAWQPMLTLRASALGVDMPCTELRARDELEPLDTFDETARSLWIDPALQSPICADVVARLADAGPPDVTAIWERLYVAMQANAFQRAAELPALLGSADRRRVEAWIEAVDEPQALLRSDTLNTNTPLNRRIVADLVIRWSRADTEAAIDWWLDNDERWTFFRDRHYDTHRALVKRAALRQEPRAYAWLESFDVRDDDLEIKEWRVRAALRDGNWSEVMRSLYRLPERERQEDHWAYWEARALEVGGQVAAANAIYAELAELQSWHGFLSADRLGQGYGLVDEAIDADATTLARLGEDLRLVRAREFAAVGLHAESRRLWTTVLDAAPRTDVAASAVLAKAWGMDDRAIFSAGRAEQRRALSYRFPVLYRSEVARASADHGIDPAWILGIMRRESAFIPDVVSHAGAVGLMQLMPRTADEVARLQQVADWDGDLTSELTNIDFGTFYIGHVAKRFDGHAALATASYNAGPTRVASWLPDETMEADRWIDTIPFNETRRYVRAVLAYAAIYEFQMTGSARRISDRLTPIEAGTPTDKS